MATQQEIRDWFREQIAERLVEHRVEAQSAEWMADLAIQEIVVRGYDITERVEEEAGATASPQKASDLPATHPLYAAFEALECAARHLSAQDVAACERDLVSVEYAPLTRLCGEAAHGLREYIAEQMGLVTGENVGLGHDAPVTGLRVVEEAPG